MDTDAFTIPKSFGVWIPIRILQQNDVSIIFLALNTKNKEIDACKLFYRSKIQGRLLQRVEEEIRIGEIAKGEGLVQVKSIIYQPEYIIMVMDYYPNGNLFDFIVKGGNISEAYTLKILHRIAKAIQILHNRGIAHRDIKLENIVFDVDFTPHLIDYGLSTQAIFPEIQLRTTLCGTYEYISPEILKTHQYDPMKADIWSLGICTYIMLTGNFPWANIQNIKELFNEIKYDPIPMEDIPSKFIPILTKMLDKDPKRRPNIEEVIQMVEKAMTPSRSFQNPSKIVKPQAHNFSKVLFQKASKKFTQRFNTC